MKKIFVTFAMVMAMFSVMAIGPEEALAHEPVDAGFSIERNEEYYSACTYDIMQDIVWMVENHPEYPIDVIGWGYALNDKCIDLYLDYIDPDTGEEIHSTDTMEYDAAWVMRCYTRSLREEAEAGVWWF